MWQEKWYYSANPDKMFKYEILELHGTVLSSGKILTIPRYLLMNGRQSSDKSCCNTWWIMSHNLDGLIWFDFECCFDGQRSNYLDWSLSTAWSMIDQHLRSLIQGKRSKVNVLRSRFGTDLDDLWVYRFYGSLKVYRLIKPLVNLQQSLGKGSKTPVTDNVRDGGTPPPPSRKVAIQKVNVKR